jgi:hypothetical protein
MSQKLAGQVALVPGASKGIGATIAKHLPRSVPPSSSITHPSKPGALSEHLERGHTFRRNVQNIDGSGRVSGLSQHGECLEGRKETANHSLGTTGMVRLHMTRPFTCSSTIGLRGCG